MSEVIARGEGTGVGVAQWAAAALFNGLSQYEDALVRLVKRARTSKSSPRRSGVWPNSWKRVFGPAPCRRRPTPSSGSPETTQAYGTDWALGFESRFRALPAEGDSADEHYRDAIERLSRTCCPAELVRARLLYGEWLRREGRRVDAREQLRIAYEQFTAIGADGFAERARRELLATGEAARRRSSETSSRTHRPGEADRTTGRRRADQPRNRRAAVHQPADRRMAPE
jgi:hypothetical protein